MEGFASLDCRTAACRLSPWSQVLLCFARCRLTTYRHRFARAAPAPRAKRNNDSKNRGRAPPENSRAVASAFGAPHVTLTRALRARPPEVAKQPRAQRA